MPRLEPEFHVGNGEHLGNGIAIEVRSSPKEIGDSAVPRAIEQLYFERERDGAAKREQQRLNDIIV